MQDVSAGWEVAFDLGGDLSIVQLSEDLAELIMNACSQRGHYFIAARQFGSRYAFVLEQPAEAVPEPTWDPDRAISEAVALSRLVRDNAYSTEYAARVVEYSDRERQVIPHDGMESRHAYTFHPESRDWLGADDAPHLRALLDAWRGIRGSLPRRLRRALWRAEHLAWEHYVDIVLPGMVFALEGLISTSSRQVTRQFVTRIPLLAEELGVAGVSKNFCKGMYAARSQAAHGEDIELFGRGPQSEAAAKAAKLQTVLRSAVRRAIEDHEFRERFGDDARVRQHWPVVVRVRACGVCWEGARRSS